MAQSAEAAVEAPSAASAVPEEDAPAAAATPPVSTEVCAPNTSHT